MRLNPAQIDCIISNAQDVLGSDVVVWLYGSRLDDQRRGGDVDLLIECPQKPTWLSRAKIKYLLESRLQLPVDVLAVQRGQLSSPFEAIARANAIQLQHMKTSLHD